MRVHNGQWQPLGDHEDEKSQLAELREGCKMGRTASDKLFNNVDDFAARLLDLHAKRKGEVADKVAEGKRRRLALTKAARREILTKTGRRCHICGGWIKGDDWQADHVLAHATGGGHLADNYLPAHFVCNNYRWHYGAEEFQWILKLGVFMRTQIERKTTLGRDAGAKFVEHEHRRDARRVGAAIGLRRHRQQAGEATTAAGAHRRPWTSRSPLFCMERRVR
jgi:hypothetical protein